MKVLAFFQGIPLEKGAFLYGIFMCKYLTFKIYTKGLLTMENKNIKNVVNAALCLALCIVLPFLTGQIPQIGSALSPMHIPVLLCGFICGWPYGLAVGFLAPLLRFMLFGMPPIFPTGIAMAFELAAYGTATGLLYKKLPKTIPGLYTSLIASMLAGRIVWGIVMAIIAGVSQVQFSFQAFLAGAFLNAMPGIICHLILIPIIIVSLQKARYIGYEYYSAVNTDTPN